MSEIPLKAANLRVREVLEASGIEFDIVLLSDAVRTAKLAAEALGCAVGQIANSLIFRNRETDTAVLVMCAGDRRVDLDRVRVATGIVATRADADFVRRETGYAIGGVPPVGHANAPVTILDSSLLRHKRIWAAAGTPESIFCMTPAELEKITGGEWLDIAVD